MKEKIYACIRKYVDDEIEITDNSLFKEELGIDSYKALALILDLNAEGITFKDEKLPSIKTVSDLLNVLK